MNVRGKRFPIVARGSRKVKSSGPAALLRAHASRATDEQRVCAGAILSCHLKFSAQAADSAGVVPGETRSVFREQQRSSHAELASRLSMSARICRVCSVGSVNCRTLSSAFHRASSPFVTPSRDRLAIAVTSLIRTASQATGSHQRKPQSVRRGCRTARCSGQYANHRKQRQNPKRKRPAVSD